MCLQINDRKLFDNFHFFILFVIIIFKQRAKLHQQPPRSHKVYMHHSNNYNYDYQTESDQEFGQTRQLLTMPQTKICDVWASNFQEQMKKILHLLPKFNVIAMDTEFPGILISRGEMEQQRYYSEQECEYVMIKRNVEQTKMIQIGLSIADEEGNVPYPICTWQFNFKWDKEKQKIVDQSYDLLVKAGVKFDKLITDGIDFSTFAQYFTGSGLVLNKKTKWVVFHGSSDFAYLLKLVLGEDLPHTIEDFYKAMKLYFPIIYDLKYIIKDVPSLKDVGLAKLSYEIGCSRIGPQHQAGSDSLLTLCCYYKMLQQSELFGHRQFQNCINVIFGIGIGYMKNSIGNYPSQNYNMQSNNYMESSQYRNYYQNRNYINHLQHHYGQYSGSGPLYNYLQGQSQYQMMYPSDRRY